MACTWGSKVNGILTVISIGLAVLIDLWDILDYKKGHSMVCLSTTQNITLTSRLSRNILADILQQGLLD